MFSLGGEDQYQDAIGIDPEAIGSVGGVTGRTLGAIMPTFQETVLTTTTLGEAPMWVTGAARTTGVFVYGSSGTVYTLSNTLSLDGDQGGIVKPTSGVGNGMAYYNDYIYLSTPTNIFRFGRLSATAPTLSNYWITGLSNSALTNSDYPSTRNITYPNHVLHPHNDGKLYIADYESSDTLDIPHGGLIHWLKTNSLGTEATSAFAELTLPPGFMPTAIESYGTDLAILCTPQAIFSGGAIPKSGESALFLWDTVSESYYRNIPIKESMATAMKNKNGELFILAGNIDTDCKLLKYLGGDSFQTLAVINSGSPPPQSAIEIFGNMICWGGNVSNPIVAAGVYSYGYRSGLLKPALHMPMRIKDASNTLPIVSCVKSILRSPYPVVGWRTDTSAEYGLDKIASSGTQSSRWRTKVYNIGKRFRIIRIRVPLQETVLTGDSIVLTVYTDTESSSTTLQTINATNFPNSEKLIDYNSLSIVGYSNFYIDFSFSGTNRQGLGLPITIDIETDEL